ncbi:MAG: PAS domain-containing protein [Burkholderiales bacterium]
MTRTTERISRGLNWIGLALLIGAAAVVVVGIALTTSIDALVTAATLAAFAFGIPGAAAFAIAFWIDLIEERANRRTAAARAGDPAAAPLPLADTIWRYGVAILAVLGAWGLRAALEAYLPTEVPFITFYLAVAVAGWLGGFGPAALATLLSAAIAGTLYVRPEAGLDAGRFLIIGVFILVCLGIAAILSALHDALAHANGLAHLWERGNAGARTPDHPLRLLAQHAPALLFMTDGAQGCTFCNRAWLELRGRTLTEELGNGWCEGVHPEDLARRREAFAETLATGETRSVTYRLRHADGTFRPVRDVVVPQRDAHGKVVGLLGATTEAAHASEPAHTA